MPQVFSNALWPFDCQEESKMNVRLSWTFMVIFALAGAFPVFQLRGWVMGSTACVIALLVFCVIKIIYAAMSGGEADHAAAGMTGILHLFSIVLYALVTATWWTACVVYFGWRLPGK